MKIIPETHHMH